LSAAIIGESLPSFSRQRRLNLNANIDVDDCMRLPSASCSEAAPGRYAMVSPLQEGEHVWSQLGAHVPPSQESSHV